MNSDIRHHDFSSPPSGTSGLAPLWLVVALCLAWMLPGLVGHDPWKPDEAYSFGLVYHMVQSGDWVVPTLAGEPFMEKPPLYYITATVFAKLLGGWLPLHDAARLATGFYIGLVFLFTGLTGRELWGRGYGRIAVLLLMGSLGLLQGSHQLVTDTALLAGFAIAFYGLALSRRRGLFVGFLLGTGTGIGFMSKGLLAPGILGLVAMALPLFFSAWRSRTYVSCLIAALLAALPWLILWPYLLYLRSPALFTEWFWVQNWGRFLGFTHQGPTKGMGFYLKMLLWFAWPVLPVALWALWREGRAGLRRPEIKLALTLFLAIFATLAFASDARSLYALPLLLPLAQLAAAGMTHLRPAANVLNRLGIAIFSILAGLIWFCWVAVMTGLPERIAMRLLSMSPGYTPAFAPLPFMAALGITFAWLILLTRSRNIVHSQGAVIHWTAGVTLVWGVLMTVGLGWIDASKSYRSMIASMQRALPAQHQCISSLKLGEPQRALLDYYADIITRRLEIDKMADCDLLLIQSGAGQLEIPPGPDWRTVWEGTRPNDRKEHYWLFQRLR